jgi:hypothetical protein
MWLHTIVQLFWIFGLLAQSWALLQSKPIKQPRRMNRSKSVLINDYLQRLEAGHTAHTAPLTRLVTVADLLLLLSNNRKDPLLMFIIESFRTTASKLSNKEALYDHENGLAKFVKRNKITSNATDDFIISVLKSLTKKELEGILPVMEVSIADFDILLGCHDKIPKDSFIVDFGDQVSFDSDKCALQFINSKNELTFLHKSGSGLFVLRPFSTAIRKGLDLSQLILLKKKKFSNFNLIAVFLLIILPFFQPDKFLWLISVLPTIQLCYMLKKQKTEFVPGEVKNFYYIWWFLRRDIRELDGRAVHNDGTPIPPNVRILYKVVQADTPKVLERFAILCSTGRGAVFDKIKSILSSEPLVYTGAINKAKIMDLVHWTIRHLPHMLADVEALVHILITEYKLNEHPVVSKLIEFKNFRDELFSRMKKNGIDLSFMYDWFKLLTMAFSLGLHKPELCALIKRTGPVKGITKQHSLFIFNVMKKWEISRLTFMKNFLFRLLQILYGHHVCLQKHELMIYVKEELAEEVNPVLNKLGVNVSVEDLNSILHRNYSTKDDIRQSDTLDLVFERLVLSLMPQVFEIVSKNQMEQVLPTPTSHYDWNMFIIPSPNVEQASSSPRQASDTEQVFAPSEQASDSSVTCAEKDSDTEQVFAPSEQASATDQVFAPSEQASATEQVSEPSEQASATEQVSEPSEQAYTSEQVPTPGVMWYLIKNCKYDKFGSIRHRVNQHYEQHWDARVNHEDKEILDISIAAKDEKMKRAKDRIISMTANYRLPVLMWLILTDFFGHGYEKFKKKMPTLKRGEYNPIPNIDDMKTLIKDYWSLQPSPISKDSKQNSYDDCKQEIQETLKRWSVIHRVLAIYEMANRKDFLVIVDADIHQQEMSLSHGKNVLYAVSVSSQALSKDKLVDMSLITTSTSWMIYLNELREISNKPLIKGKKFLSSANLKKEAMAFLINNKIPVIKYRLHGSAIHHEEKKRVMCGDVDFIVMVAGNPLEISLETFVASDGTRCDFMFVAVWWDNKTVEEKISELMGEKWSDELSLWSRFKAYIQNFREGKKETLAENMSDIAEAYGKKIHQNENAIDRTEKLETKSHYAYQSVKMVLTLVLLILKRKQFPVYNAVEFFPSTFTKKLFVKWINENNFNPHHVVSIFTKQQLTFVNGIFTIQSGEKKYLLILEALPIELKNILINFKAEGDKLIGKDVKVHGVWALIKDMLPFL